MDSQFGKNRLSGFNNALSCGTSLQNWRYTITEVCGQGPFTITYLAHQNILGRKVVINELFLLNFAVHGSDNKVINNGLSDTVYLNFRKKWFEVAMQLSRCSRHENFVTVMDAFEENNTVYYVTDYAGEEDLRTYTLAQKGKRLEEEQALNFIYQIAGGLSFLHDNNIYHLNLSPVKVMIEKGDRLTIFSVGIARNHIPPEIVPDVSVLARHGYTAPELYTRATENGRQADVFSIGAILYFLLTGKDPLSATERKTTSMPEPEKINPTVTSGTNAAVMKAMALAPSERYLTIEDFMQDLRKAKRSSFSGKAHHLVTYAAAALIVTALVISGITILNRNPKPVQEKARTGLHAISREDQISGLNLEMDPGRGITMLSDKTGQDTLLIGINYALLIGIEKYQDPRYQKLSQPVNDARTLSSVLTSLYTFNARHVTLLENPDKKAIFRTLNFYRDSITHMDNLLVFYAGHGRYDQKADMGYIIPVNGDYQNDADWISFQEIREKFDIIPAKHILLIADACFAGSVFRGEDSISGNQMMVIDQISRKSRTAFTSAYLQPVPDRSEFLRHLISILKNNRGKCMLSEDLYINTRNSLNKSTSRTDPVKYGIIRDCGDEGGDFIFIKKEK